MFSCTSENYGSDPLYEYESEELAVSDKDPELLLLDSEDSWPPSKLIGFELGSITSCFEFRLLFSSSMSKMKGFGAVSFVSKFSFKSISFLVF